MILRQDIFGYLFGGGVMLRRFILVFLLVEVFLFFIGISYGTAQSEAVLWWRTRPDSQAEVDLYQSISDSIDVSWSGVSLVYEPSDMSDAEYRMALLRAFQAGHAPDVFWVPAADIGTFVEVGAVLNVVKLADAVDFDTEVFYPQQMQQLSYDAQTDDYDVLWGLPRDASVMVVYYNADLFDEVGLDYPDVQVENDEWDWEAFEDAAQSISDLGNDVYGFGMNAHWANWLLFVNEAGDDYFDKDGAACGFTERSSDAIAFLQELYSGGAAVPFGGGVESAFVDGRVGMFMSGRWSAPSLVDQAGFNWNVAEVPVGPEGRSNRLLWGAYVVSTGTEHPVEAFDLITRLTSAEVQNQVTELGAAMPSRVGEETGITFLRSLTDFKPDLNSQAWMNGLDYALVESPLWRANFRDIDAAVGELVGEAIRGEVSAGEFPAAACDLIAPFFEAGA